ncbi:hypothetical protein [Nonomuraea roseola]|uniref:Uncharacterized protein n=1 Tax=Nonomuraea roseola TaxID=46179 RepID=A0ABV5PSA0_9ACTN
MARVLPGHADPEPHDGRVRERDTLIGCGVGRRVMSWENTGCGSMRAGGAPMR